MATTENKTVSHFLDSISENDMVTEDSSATQTSDTENEGEDINKTESEEETEEVIEDQHEETEEDETLTEEVEEEFSFSPLVQTLIEEDIIKPIEGKEYDDSVEGYKELIQDTAHSFYNEYKDSLVNETSKKFLDFLENGGSPDDFIEATSQFPDYDKVDTDDESTQKMLIRQHYEILGWDEEDIDSQIEEFEDTGSIGRHSKTALKYLTKHRQEYMDGLIEKQKEQEQTRVQSLEQERQRIAEFISTNKVIAGLPVNKADETKFVEYLTKPVKKDAQGNLYSKYLLDITEEDKIKMAFLKYKNFDLSSIETKIETKKSTELKKALSKFKDTMSTKNNRVVESNESSDKFPSLSWL